VRDVWTRPYSPGNGRWLVIAWEAVALAILGWTSEDRFHLTGPGIRLMWLALAVTWVVGSARIVDMGVYVAPAGVRIRGLLRTRTVRWSDINRIWLHRATHRLGPLEIPSGMTVLLERHDGTVINTELWAQGVDFHRRPKLFRAVYHELRDRHHAATRPA
jgi:hypothetical protein